MQYDPLGVVLVIGPWNYPLYLSLGAAGGGGGRRQLCRGQAVRAGAGHLGAAGAAGAAVPGSEAVRVVEGDAAVTQDLLAQGFDHALFTGGTEIGKKIMAAAAPTLTPVTLELGGKSPVIVAADADIDVAARRIAWVKLLNSGQTCIAPDYVLAERSIAGELVDKIVANVREFRSAKAIRRCGSSTSASSTGSSSLISTTDGTVAHRRRLRQRRRCASSRP